MNRMRVFDDTVVLSGGTDLEGYRPAIEKLGLTAPIPPEKDSFAKG